MYVCISFCSARIDSTDHHTHSIYQLNYDVYDVHSIDFLSCPSYPSSPLFARCQQPVVPMLMVMKGIYSSQDRSKKHPCPPTAFHSNARSIEAGRRTPPITFVNALSFRSVPPLLLVLPLSTVSPSFSLSLSLASSCSSSSFVCLIY